MSLVCSSKAERTCWNDNDKTLSHPAWTWLDTVRPCIPLTDEQHQSTTIQNQRSRGKDYLVYLLLHRSTTKKVESVGWYLERKVFNSIPGMGDELLHSLFWGCPRILCCGVRHHFHWDGQGTWFWERRKVKNIKDIRSAHCLKQFFLNNQLGMHHFPVPCLPCINVN